MSPTSSVYDHLTINLHQKPNMIMRKNSQSNYENLHILTKRKIHPIDEQEQTKRRYTVTNISIPRYSVNNPAYNKSMIQKSSTASNIDFRPLIIQGRRKFGAFPSSSSMIIIKKKSPSPMNNISFNQKPLFRSIPVDIINNNATIACSCMIPSSLSYSSSSSSPTSASSTNAGTVFLPIQVTKSQHNNNNSIKNSTSTANINEGQKGYRYVQKQKSTAFLNTENYPTHLDDESTRNSSSSSSIRGEGRKYRSTIMMDSNVLRLIRRYDPVGSNAATTSPVRRSLESTRGIWHTVGSQTGTSQASDTSPFLSRRSLTTTYEDEIPKKQSSIPRLQRQQAIPEQEPAPSPPSIRPILKYNSSRSRSEFILQPHQVEPLTIEIDPYIPPPNESSATYQPLITTGTKRVCSALSKSEWDLRLQQEQFPVQTPSFSSLVINQQQEKESYRPSIGRSKSSVTINHNNDQDEDIDNFDENSAPIIPNGSCVEKLKQLFVTKSSLDITNPSINKTHRDDSIDSNLNQYLNPIDVSSSSIITPQQNLINKPAISTPTTSPSFNKRPILKSQITIDSSESVSHSNQSSLMPTTELSHDAYRFRRVNDLNPVTPRPRNIAKVEPYSINTTTVRPIYQSQPVTTTTAVPLKARINLNSMGNTPTNSSTSSSAGSLGGMFRHPNIRHSDFLMPNPAYPTSPPQPLSNSSSYTTPPILLSESLSHGSLHHLPIANIPAYNHIRTTGLASSTNNSQHKSQRDFYPTMHTSSPSTIPATSYHYRPPPTTVINNNRPMYPTVIEPQQQDELINGNQQSRRRFQKRKQMKRSKSVDLYQEPSSFISPTIPQELNTPSRQQKSISREYIAGGGENLSSSGSSTSLTADIERVNRAALLRYKSLDSVTFNNRKTNFNGRNHNNRRAVSKPTEFDFDSDDSVCGIPKPRKTIGR